MRFACYWGSAKPRVLELMRSFARSCDGELVHPSQGLRPNAVSVFYGVTEETIGLYTRVVDEGRPYLYFDNGYLKSRYAGGDYYRITWNAEQCDGTGASDCRRFDELGIEIQDWRGDGDRVLVVLQSPWWYKRHGTSLEEYRDTVARQIRAASRRPVEFREKPGFSYTRRARSEEILRGVWAVVTHSSALAIDAVLMGIPAFCTARCAASPVTKNDLSSIEYPFHPPQRRIWAGVLADNQWSGEEIANGTAWRMLEERVCA